MSDAPKSSDKLLEGKAEERFRRPVGKLMNTRHKPHKDEPKKRERQK
jgi:hypothetical protein